MSNETNNNEYLLKVDHLKQYFPVHDGFKKMELKAVDDVSFAIKPGERLWKDNRRTYSFTSVPAYSRTH